MAGFWRLYLVTSIWLQSQFQGGCRYVNDWVYMVDAQDEVEDMQGLPTSSARSLGSLTIRFFVLT